jgi:hypothetical protein
MTVRIRNEKRENKNKKQRIEEEELSLKNHDIRPVQFNASGNVQRKKEREKVSEKHSDLKHNHLPTKLYTIKKLNSPQTIFTINKKNQK